MKQTSQKLYILSWMVLFSAVIYVLVCLYWLVYPYEPIKVFDTPSRVENKVVKRGDSLFYYVSFCKYMDVNPLITKQFVDGVVYVVPPIVATDNGVGCNTKKVQMYIPNTLPVGIYYLHITYRYQVNPIRYIDYAIDTEKFRVSE